MSDETEPRTPSVVVTGGGEPSPEELAALVVALTPVVVAEVADEMPDTGPRGWRRAALIEGVGGRAPVSYPDLVGGRFGLGHIGDPAVHP